MLISSLFVLCQSPGYQWQQRDHLLLIYSCCLAIDKTHYLMSIHDFWTISFTNSLNACYWIRLYLNCLGYLNYPQGKDFVVLYCSSSEPVQGDSRLNSLTLCSFAVFWSDLVLGCGSICAASTHYVATGYLASDVAVPINNMLSLTSLITLISFPSSSFPPLNNAALALAEQGTLCRMSPGHNKASDV